MHSPSPTPRRPITLLLIMLALVVAWPAALAELLVAPAARAVAPGGNGRIIFVGSTATPEHPEGERGIFSMSADGSDRRLLTGDEVTFEHATIGLAISPDGRQIAFSDDTQDIHLMDVDGGNVRRITTGLVSYGPLAWSPDGSKIAYIQVGARHDIWVMNTDGSNRTQLTNNASSINTRPDWSPDGTRIVYEANPPGGGLMGIWVMDANGANGVRIVTTGDDPAWSPDGKRIAFTRGGDLYTVKPDGSDEERVTNTPEFDANVTWAPAGNRLLVTTDSPQGGTDLFTIKPDGTGRQRLTDDRLSTAAVWQSGASIPNNRPPKVVQRDTIIFSSHRVTAENPEGDSELFVLELDPLRGEVVRQLTVNTDSDQMPQWSPDGTRIVFVRNDSIYTMNADGSNALRLTDVPSAIHHDRSPTWSPDGTRIAFTSNRDKPVDDVYVMRSDGSEVTRITTENGSSPDWSPDGTKIAFTRGIHHSSAGPIGLHDCIFTVNPDGTGLTQLTFPDQENSISPAWSPDGTKIVFANSRGLGNTINTMRSDGSNMRTLTANNATVGSPRWSPDGKRIVFQRETLSDPQYDIYSMKANGTDLTRRTNDPAWDTAPDWGKPATQAAAAAGVSGNEKKDRQDKPRKDSKHKKHHKNKKKHRGHAGDRHGNQRRDSQDEPRERPGKHKQRVRQKQRKRAGKERDAPRRGKARERRHGGRASPGGRGH